MNTAVPSRNPVTPALAGLMAGNKDTAVRPALFFQCLSLTMTRIHITNVPPDSEIHTGARGAKYFLRNGQKVYVTTKYERHTHKFTPKRGAFLRFIENQGVL